jgi:hypothetical protein
VAKEFIINEPTIKTSGADIVEDAFRITWRALPSGVVFSELFLVKNNWTPELIDQQGEMWANRWNQNALVPGVAGIVVTQETNVAGNLEDVAQVTVVSTSVNSSSLIKVPVRNWLPDVSGTTLTTSFGDVIRAEVARLDAIEAGGTAAA